MVRGVVVVKGRLAGEARQPVTTYPFVPSGRYGRDYACPGSRTHRCRSAPVVRLRSTDDTGDSLQRVAVAVPARSGQAMSAITAGAGCIGGAESCVARCHTTSAAAW